jgi:hypothetical protein
LPNTGLIFSLLLNIEDEGKIFLGIVCLLSLESTQYYVPEQSSSNIKYFMGYVPENRIYPISGKEYAAPTRDRVRPDVNYASL